MSDADRLRRERELGAKLAKIEQQHSESEAQCQALREHQEELHKQHQAQLDEAARKLEAQRRAAEEQRRMSDADRLRQERELDAQKAQWEEAHRKDEAKLKELTQALRRQVETPLSCSLSFVSPSVSEIHVFYCHCTHLDSLWSVGQRPAVTAAVGGIQNSFAIASLRQRPGGIARTIFGSQIVCLDIWC